MKTKNPELSRTSVPKITYIASMDGIVFTPAAARMYVKEACMLTVINWKIFSRIRNDVTNTYPQAPTARIWKANCQQTFNLRTKSSTDHLCAGYVLDDAERGVRFKLGQVRGHGPVQCVLAILAHLSRTSKYELRNKALNYPPTSPVFSSASCSRQTNWERDLTLTITLARN